jgi:hypothetical protein
MTTIHKLPSANEIETAKIAIENLERIIDKDAETHKLIVNGDELQLPSTALKSLLNMLDEIAKGNAVTITTIRPNLTIHEAADLLNVSPQAVIKLIDSKLLPSTVTDSRRTFAYYDVIELKERLQQDRLDALNELSRVDQESKNGY